MARTSPAFERRRGAGTGSARSLSIGAFSAPSGSRGTDAGAGGGSGIGAAAGAGTGAGTGGTTGVAADTGAASGAEGGGAGSLAGKPMAGSGLMISCQHFGQGPCMPAMAAGTVSTAPQ